jgi:hypothetical protein
MPAELPTAARLAYCKSQQTDHGAEADMSNDMQHKVKKAWAQPELRKLPIEATANSTAKGGVNACDGGPGCPKADAAGQFS